MDNIIPERKGFSIFKRFNWKQKPNGENKLISSNSNSNDIFLNRKASFNCSNKNTEIQMKIIDNTEKFKNGMTVMTEWGIGKLTSINEGEIALVKIEGSDVEFPLMSLNTSLTLFCCILCKDKCFWTETKLGFDYTVNTLKKKISLLIKCHPSQIVLVHAGTKVEKNVNIFELGIYEKDVLLAVIKNPQENSILRSKNHKTTNKNPIYNAIKFKVNEDVILTGLGLYKNNSKDVIYQILIFEEDANMNLKLIFSEKKIFVSSQSGKENPIFKHKISNLLINETKLYQIHQYLDNTDSNQNIGVACAEELLEKNTEIKFSFFNCNIQGRTNSTDLEEGLIPEIYFNIKSDL